MDSAFVADQSTDLYSESTRVVKERFSAESLSDQSTSQPSAPSIPMVRGVTSAHAKLSDKNPNIRRLVEANRTQRARTATTTKGKRQF